MRGMKGMSVHEVVRTVRMTPDMACLRGQVVDVLTNDLAKYFDVAPDAHPTRDNHVGLGTTDHLSTHTEGYSTPWPWGPCKAGCYNNTRAFPKARYKKCTWEPQRPSHSSGTCA